MTKASQLKTVISVAVAVAAAELFVLFVVAAGAEIFLGQWEAVLVDLPR